MIQRQYPAEGIRRSSRYGMTRAPGGPWCREVGAGTVQWDSWPNEWGLAMNDVLYVSLALGFFALSWAFIRLCDRL
jgi:hypothetical protein